MEYTQHWILLCFAEWKNTVLRELCMVKLFMSYWTKEICLFRDVFIKGLAVLLTLSSNIMAATSSWDGFSTDAMYFGFGCTTCTHGVYMSLWTCTHCIFHTYSFLALCLIHTEAGSHGRRECKECSKPWAGVLTRPRLHAVTAGVCGQTSLCQTHWLQHPPRPAELQLATHN